MPDGVPNDGNEPSPPLEDRDDQDTPGPLTAAKAWPFVPKYIG